MVWRGMVWRGMDGDVAWVVGDGGGRLGPRRFASQVEAAGRNREGGCAPGV